MTRSLILFFLLFSFETRAQKLYKVDWFLDSGIAAAGVATASISYLLADKWIDKRCPCDPNEVGAFDRGAIGKNSQAASTGTDILLGVSVLGPALADYLLLGWGRELWEDALIYTQTLALSGALVTLVKHISQRPLPRTYAGDTEAIASAEGYRSFYSGHTTLAVTALSAASFTAARRYSAKIWPWIVTGGVGVAMGLGRVAAGHHFYTDVLVGLGAGALIGIAVPWLHTASSGTISILPIEDGARVTWTALL